MSATEPRYLRARREWDERYGDLARGKRNWQHAALGLLVANLVLAAALAWLSTRSRVTPWVVEVDRLGQAVAFGPAERLRPTDERLIRYQLNLYVHHLRTVLADTEAQRELLERGYDYSRGAAVVFLNRHFSRRNPFELAKSGRIRVQLQSILPLSEASWQVQWLETRQLPGGRDGEESRWQAVLTVELDPPETTETILKNPLGLYVTEISWTQVL